MDPKLKELFDALRAEIGKSVEGLARLDELQRKLEAGEKSRGETETELKKLREANETVTKTIDEIRRESKLRVQREGVTDKQRGLAILGMQLRAQLAQHLGVRLDAAFDHESKEIEAFRAQRATLSADAAGGSYTVPTIVEGMILDTLEQVSPLLAMCDFQPGLPGKMDIPTLTGRPSLSYKRATVDTAMTQTDPTIGRLQFNPDEGYIFFPIDNRLLEMSAVRLGEMATGLIRDGIMDALGYAVLNADGSSSYNSITGLLNETTAGYIHALPSGKTGFSDVTKGDLTAAKAKALRRAQNAGSWVVGSYVLGLFEDFDRTGKREVVTTSPNGETRVLGNPIVIEPYMPTQADSGAGKAFAVFGDLRTVFVGMVGGIKLGVSTEFLFNKNQTAFRGVVNFDIKRKPFAGLITLKTAAA